MPYKDPAQRAAANKHWRVTNREKRKADMLEWQRTNREHVREYQRAYYAENESAKISQRARSRRRRSDDVQFRLAANLRTRLGMALKKRRRSGSAVRDLGCTVDELKQYLEARFQPGMTWENWGRAGWHIDHIRPLASFDLSDRSQFLQACHYANLQPLWATDNIKKSDTAPEVCDARAAA